MSLRRSYLSRRIIHRSFSLSKSYKETKSTETKSICSSSNDNLRGEEEQIEENQCGQHRRDGVVSPVESESGSWAGLLPELLGEIIQRVEASEDKWPQRQNVVACGCVCKRWRDATAEAVEIASLRQPGKITFPSSLKKAGPRDAPLQCLIKRDKKNATFCLYLALTPCIVSMKSLGFGNYDTRRYVEAHTCVYECFKSQLLRVLSDLFSYWNPEEN